MKWSLSQHFPAISNAKSVLAEAQSHWFRPAACVVLDAAAPAAIRFAGPEGSKEAVAVEDILLEALSNWAFTGP